MEYIISFLEGIITFISPCLLPMLPIYVSYFVGAGSKKALLNAVGFVLGFTAVFLVLGAFAGAVGSLLTKYQSVVNIVTGAVVILFGLNFMGVLRIGFLNKTFLVKNNADVRGFFSSVVFGVVFSISWTPCIGAFLSSVLMLASQQGSAAKGTLLLLIYSLGLGLPFVVSAVLIDKLKGAFDFIKRNYNVINIVSGLFLVAVGILMMTGFIGYFLALLTF